MSGEFIKDRYMSPAGAFINGSVLVESFAGKSPHKAIPGHMLNIYLESLPRHQNRFVRLWLSPLTLLWSGKNTFSSQELVKSRYAPRVAKVLLQVNPQAYQPKSLVVAMDPQDQFYLLLRLLGRMSLWPVRSVHQRLQAAVPPRDPAVNTLATDTVESCCGTDVTTFHCLLNYTLTKLGYLSYT